MAFVYIQFVSIDNYVWIGLVGEKSLSFGRLERSMLNVIQPEGVHVRTVESCEARMIESEAEYESERRSLLAQRELLQQQWMEELEIQKRLLEDLQQKSLNHIDADTDLDADKACAGSSEADAAVEEDMELPSGETPTTRECLQLSVVIFSHFLKIFGGFVLLFAVVFTSMFGCCAVSASQLLLVSSALPLYFYWRGKGQG